MPTRLSWRGPGDDPVLVEAARLLAGGGVVACPTETFYALAVDALQEAALQRLFTLKGRPAAKAVLVLVADQAMASEVAAVITPVARTLMSRFWPGPLTLILPAKAGLPELLTARTGTVGLRQPGHPLARRLCRLYGRPLTGTSANLSGRPPLCQASEVLQELGDSVDLILKDGPCVGDLPSTILNVTGQTPQLIRPGAISVAELEKLIGPLLR